jgi:hypothetical protein
MVLAKMYPVPEGGECRLTTRKCDSDRSEVFTSTFQDEAIRRRTSINRHG